MSDRVIAVTTFHVKHWSLYARRMVETFDAHWPRDVVLHAFVDGGDASFASDRVRFHRDAIRHAARFKDRYAHLRRSPSESGYDYRMDALRFCHKPLALLTVTEAVACEEGGTLLWLDADTLTHTPVTREAIQRMCPSGCDVSYLARPHKYSELGFAGFNLNRRGSFQVARWAGQYLEGSFLREREWHDSYLFDVAITLRAPGEVFYNLAQGLVGKAAGNPFINGPLGLWMDHLKGSRKAQGRTPPTQCKTHRDHPYWKGR